MLELNLVFFRWTDDVTGLPQSPTEAQAAETNYIFSFPPRVNNNPYTTSEAIRITTTDPGQVWRCTTAGTSAATPPVFPADAIVGDTVAEVTGTLVWTFIGKLGGDTTLDFSVERYYDKGVLHNSTQSAIYVLGLKPGDRTVIAGNFLKGQLSSTTMPALLEKDHDGNIIVEEIYVAGKHINKDDFYLMKALIDLGMTLSGEGNNYAALTGVNDQTAFDLINSQKVTLRGKSVED